MDDGQWEGATLVPSVARPKWFDDKIVDLSIVLCEIILDTELIPDR